MTMSSWPERRWSRTPYADEEEHEEGAALAGGGGLEGLGERLVEGEDLAAAAEGLDGGAGMVGGEIEDAGRRRRIG